MAKRVSRKAPEQGATPDLEVLHPDRVIVVGGKPVTVREYGSIEWLRMLPAAEPLVASIAGLLEGGRGVTYEDALMVIALHTDALLPMVAQAADVDLPFVDTLPPNDLEALLMTWWGVNHHFFVQRASNRVMVAARVAQLAASAGARSTQPSSPTATEPGTSGSTPSAS